MPKVLVIDDDQEICRVIGNGLRREGYEVQAASNGNEGLSAAAAMMPDLILCDLDMPSLNGHGVVAALRQDKRLGEIPVIFLSACVERDQIRQSMNLGGDDFLTKPAPWPEILAAVTARLSRRQKQLEQLDVQVQEAAEVFAGIIHDLNKSAPEVRWLADTANSVAGQQNRIIQRVHQSLNAAHSPSVPQRPDSLLIKDSSQQQLLKLSEVKALMACGEYSDVYWGKNRHMMFRKPLKQWAAELPSEQFIRIHRQAIINMAFLDFVKKDAEGKMQVHLLDFDKTIPVSQRETPAFNRCLKKFKTLKPGQV
jgi:two-component system, OmpR family, alkaline phosphatase synthesis response regulator PhoP